MVKLESIAKEQRPAGRRRGVGLVLEEIVIGLLVSKSYEQITQGLFCI